MAEIRLTPAQQAVVEHRGSALLVSAAAGSGKTKVLVDRLLNQICDPDCPCNIDDFLIITYTKAAASELRSKIARSISEKLAEMPENRHLRSQLSRIYLAEISTVHSFCSGILRNYAYLLDIPADFRIAETEECAVLKERAVQNVLAAGYERGNDPSFTEFFDTLGYGRDDRSAVAMILSLYDKAQSHADPEAWLQQGREALKTESVTSMEETVWGQFLMADTADFLREEAEVLHRLLLLSEEESVAKYHPVLEEDLLQIERLLGIQSWDRIREYPLTFQRSPTIRKCEDLQLKNQIQNLRDVCKKQLKKHLSVFSVSSEEALTNLRRMSGQLEGLFDLTEAFGKEFTMLKRRRRILDFGDLEHLSVRLLTDRYGQPTEIARTVSERFTEILVDEYQDSNAVQDTIFRAVSRNGENLFFVGDLKQSIYRFRLADPDIFLQKYHTYREKDENAGGPVKIRLSENFRSRPEILEAVNFVCSAVMSERVGDLAYTEAEMLRTTQDFPDTEDPPVELHIIQSKGDSQEEDSPERREVEARFVAGRIAELLRCGSPVRGKDGLRPVRPEDIVILLRSPKDEAGVYQNALLRAGIPVQRPQANQFLKSTEIRTVISLLKIIQNPHQDIPLLSVLAGPIGGFSAEELAEIRCPQRSTDFFDALSASEKSKAKKFLAMLENLRKMRRWMDLPHLLEAIYSETDLLTVFGASPEGAQRCDNLRRFRALCAGSAERGIRSLHDLVLFLDDLDRQDFNPQAESSTESVGVSILSIHKSKGLEFPVVFLSSLSKSFNLQDMKDKLMTDPELFVASRVIDKEMLCSVSGPARTAVILKNTRETISEELRVLYVAMTRAKDRLIMTYCAPNAEKKLQTAAENASYPVLPMIASSVSCPGQWILLSAASRPEAQHLFGGSVTVPCRFRWRVEFHQGAEAPTESPVCVFSDADKPEFDSVCLDHSYPHTGSTRIPAKLTATQLKGRNLDAESAESAATEVQNRRPHVRAFSLRTQPGTLSASERGTALHKFLQFCAYASCQTEAGCLSEVNRLKEQEFLTSEEADSIAPLPIVRFFSSELGQEILHAENLRREFKFSVLTDAAEFYPEAAGESILLQGVVDCFVLQEDGITILDYKTDRIRPGTEDTHAESYRPQITAYAAALEKIFERKVKRKIIYFFATGIAVEM